MIHLLSEVPVVTIGGAPGAVHIVTLVFHLPTKGCSTLCASPGVIAFCIASIAAFSSGDIDCLEASCAIARPEQRTSRAAASHVVNFIGIFSFARSVAPPPPIGHRSERSNP